VSVVDSLATPMVAQTIDIETAAYSGRISNANDSGFTYTRDFARVTDDYSLNLSYISASTPNGTDAMGNPIMGFKWWNFTFPTLETSGTGAISAFLAATDGGVNFGGSVGSLTAWGVSAAIWADPSNTSGWSVRDVVLMPTPLPLGTVTAPFSSNSNTFAMSVLGGTMPATVEVSPALQSATLIYQVDRSNGVVTVSPIDITTQGGLATFAAAMGAGVPVKVYGVPQGADALKAYVVTYFTGTLPSM
jgi:hypothetical protein